MKHCSKAFAEMVDKARKLGCRIDDRGNTVVVYPADKNLQQYIAHKSERAFHPLRRFLKNVCKLSV